MRTTAKTCKQNCCLFHKLFIFLTLLIRLLPRFLSRISRVLCQTRMNKILSRVSRGNGNLRENPRSCQELQEKCPLQCNQKDFEKIYIKNTKPKGDSKYVFEVLDVGFVSFCFRPVSEASSVLNLHSSSC